MKKFFIAILIVFSAIILAAPASADYEKIDELIHGFEQVMPPEPVTLTLEDCIELAMENNHELKMKLAVLNSVVGEEMKDRSRFFSHYDFVGSFNRGRGSISKAYYAALNPQSVSSLGTLDSSTFSASTSSSGGGSSIPGDISSLLGGVDMSQISTLAAQYGIALRPAPPQAEQAPVTAAERYLQSTNLGADGRSTNRTAAQQLDPAAIQALSDALAGLDPEAINNLANSLAGLDVEAINNAANSLSSVNSLLSGSSSSNTKNDNNVAIRYSRRLIEWGKDSSSSIQIRKNRYQAIYNYQAKLREVISSVRVAFFTILLKKEQIETRQKLLAEYEKKLWQQEKRFEIAKDVPRIDVLTAELDVLNEKNRINALKADLVEKKYELLQIVNKPLDSTVVFLGDFQPLKASLEQVVNTTMDNSFKIVYYKAMFHEDEKKFAQLAWDYKPTYSGTFGWENRRTGLGVSLNNSDQTYGLDVGAAQYINLPANDAAHGSPDFNMNLEVRWNLYDNMHRKGVNKVFLEQLNEAKHELSNNIEQEELDARKAYNDLMEAEERLEIQEDIVANAKRRLEITRKLREYGKVNEYQVDTYRDTFFTQQDRYFTEQENLIIAQEKLRSIMGNFE